MDTSEEMHRKIAKVVRFQCQAAIESAVAESGLGELICASRAWQNAVKCGDPATVQKCEADFTAAWEKFEVSAEQSK